MLVVDVCALRVPSRSRTSDGRPVRASVIASNERDKPCHDPAHVTPLPSAVGAELYSADLRRLR
jgi:hypothetical protein